LSAQEEITWAKAGQTSTERKLAINPCIDSINK